MVDLSGTMVKLGMQIGTGVIGILIIVVLFFVSKFGMKWYKTRKNYKIQVNIYNVDGTFWQDKIGKFRTADNIDKMVFMSSQETMPVIDTKYIIANQVTLWRYAPSQYAVIPPRMWNKKPESFGLEV